MAIAAQRSGLWRHSEFLKLWSAQTISLFGSLIGRFALPLVAIYTLNASPFQVATLGAANVAPGLALGLFAGVWVDRLRRRPLLIAADLGRALALATVPLAYWAMDLNPDQLLALNKIPRGGLVARTLEAGNRLVLQNATLVVALDRFMAERLRPRARLRDKMVVIPPWPHETFVDPVSRDENPFRKKHGLERPFVLVPRASGSDGVRWDRIALAFTGPIPQGCYLERRVDGYATTPALRLTEEDLDLVKRHGVAVGLDTNQGTIWAEGPGNNITVTAAGP